MGVASTAKSGIGVLLQVSDGASPAVWATVANVTQLSGGGTSVTVLDSTHLDSPDFYSEKLPGLKSADDWSFTVQWDPTDATLDQTTGLGKYVEDRSLETFRINAFQLGITTAIECDAYVTQLGNIEISPDGIMTRSVTLSVVGKPREVTVASI